MVAGGRVILNKVDSLPFLRMAWHGYLFILDTTDCGVYIISKLSSELNL